MNITQVSTNMLIVSNVGDLGYRVHNVVEGYSSH
jgi:hypothetical protein